MARKAASAVFYENAQVENVYRVRRLKEATRDDARNVRVIMRSAYEQEFEDSGVLPCGSMAGHFGDPNDSLRIESQQDRMDSHIANGGSYWLLDTVGEDVPPLALVRTSPSRGWLQELFGRPAHVYINEVVVAPETATGELTRGMRLGSMALHAALTHDIYNVSNNSTKAVADTFSLGKAGQAFAAQLGFSWTGEASPTYFSQNLELEMDRRDAQLGQVVAQLESQVPWLAGGHVVYP